MSNSVDLDETAHYEPSHLDLSCLQKTIIIARDSERTLSPLGFWNGLFHSWTWTCPLMQIGFQSWIYNKMANSKSRWDGSLWAFSSGSTLFAEVTVLMCRVERVKSVVKGSVSNRFCLNLSADNWDCKFESQFGLITLMEIDLKIISKDILPFLLIQEGQLLVYYWLTTKRT